MTLQEIIKSLDDLSVADRTLLLTVLQGKLSQTVDDGLGQPANNAGETFWQGILRFRTTIEQEGIVFDGSEFEGLRDLDPTGGRHLACQPTSILPANQPTSFSPNKIPKQNSYPFP